MTGQFVMTVFSVRALIHVWMEHVLYMKATPAVTTANSVTAQSPAMRALINV